MWPHLQACVTGPLQKITLILYRDRHVAGLGWRGGGVEHREDPVLQRTGAFEGPREHKPLTLYKYPTLNTEA